jgi:hypothetical protein
MIEFARSTLAVNERAARYFADSELRGRLRFGASKDFVTSLLPEVFNHRVEGLAALNHPFTGALGVDLGGAEQLLFPLGGSKHWL